MALVFTAISDSICELLLWRRRIDRAAPPLNDPSLWKHAAVIALVSLGLYGFGMSLNDIIDRRRDRQTSPHRPLPSGRIGVLTANVIAALLILLALAGGALYAHLSHQEWMPLILVIWTGILIVFYDYAGKYLVALGLLTLGLIRLFHAVIHAPSLPLLWHPLLLFNHVTILSLVAYRWEEKRPSLTRVHWWVVLGGVGAIDVLLVALVLWRRMVPGRTVIKALWITPGLIAPAAAIVVFIFLAAVIYSRSTGRREAGQTLMLYGLLWLIVYDFSFVAGYVNLASAFLLLLLLPAAYASVQIMRWWGRVIALSQRPAFKRADH
jgi:hypothetical protein